MLETAKESLNAIPELMTTPAITEVPPAGTQPNVFASLFNFTVKINRADTGLRILKNFTQAAMYLALLVHKEMPTIDIPNDIAQFYSLVAKLGNVAIPGGLKWIENPDADGVKGSKSKDVVRRYMHSPVSFAAFSTPLYLLLTVTASATSCDKMNLILVTQTFYKYIHCVDL